MTQHTPGPWRAMPPNNAKFSYRRTWEVGAVNEPDAAIAAVNGLPDEDGVDMAEVEANARLIAAAPDLLAIVQEIAADSHDLGRVTADTLDRAEAIIAKVTVR